MGISTILLALSVSLGGEPAVDYVREVKPILAEKCFACHGSLQQKGSLRLDTAALIREGGGKGPAIVAGKSGESLLIEHLLEKNGRRRMPPPSEGEALSGAQIATIRRWIDQGAPSPADEKAEADPRDHWAFRAPVKPSIPENDAKNPIDAFLLETWRAKGVTPQPTVDRRLLLRRLYLQLIGLPPTLEEIEAFLNDASPDAVETIVDRLLQSPQYGQRWGRHWMDVWRYSDPWGLGAEIRNSQKHIYHWRDWIIDSLNADKGYDQMVREMLAADELYPNDLDRLRGTGFLVRQYFRFNRTTWLDETVEHTSKAFLGLTFNCAKCHDHKYDPISQTDYYRLRAFFEPYQIRTEQIPGEVDVDKNGIPRAYDANLDAPTFLFVRGDDRQPAKDRPLSPGLPKLLTWQPLVIEPAAMPIDSRQPGLRPHVLENHLRAAETQIAVAEKALEKAKADLAAGNEDAKRRLELLVTAAEKAVAAARAQPDLARARIAAERAKYDMATNFNDLARAAAKGEKVVALLQAEENLARAEAEVLGAMPDKRSAAEAKRDAAAKAVPVAAKAVEIPIVSYTPLRGARKTPESNVDNSAATVWSFPATSTGRRTALAQWMTDRKNPLTARVAVNHIWARHFGTPLVASVFDFGRKGAAPSHPELLDHLAVDFMDHGWSMKRLHRLIATSEHYRRSSSALDADPKTVKIDPENRLSWRREPVRMEAQLLRDNLMHLAGALDLRLGGPPVPIADELSPRRSVYFLHSNNDNQKFLALFDDAQVRECYRRSDSIVPQQALALANSKLAITMAEKINARLHPKSRDDAEFIRMAFEYVLATTPSPEELAACREALDEWRAAAPKNGDADRRARGHLIHALLNHNDFITVR